MKEITTIIIESIEIHGFKGIDHYGVDLDEKYNLFLADNGKGKTSLAEAAYWGFTGDVLEKGVSGSDIINLNMEKAVVIIKFKDQNGELHELNRTRASNGYLLLFDGVKTTQKDFEKMYNKEAFAVSSPLYFLSLPPEQARKFLINLLPQILEEEVRAAISSNHTMIKSFDNIPKQIKDLKAEFKQNKEALILKEGELKAKKESLKEIKLSFKEDIYDEQIKKLMEQTLEKANIEKQIKVQKNVIEAESRVVFQDIFNETAMVNQIKVLRENYSREVSLAEKYKKESESFNKIYKDTLESVESYLEKTNCPVCGVATTNESLLNIKSYVENTLKKRIEREKKNLDDSIESFNKSKSNYEKYKEEGIKKKAEYEKIKAENEKQKTLFEQEKTKKIALLNDQLNLLIQNYNSIDISEVEKQIIELKKKQQEILSFNASLEKEIKIQKQLKKQIIDIQNQIEFTIKRNDEIQIMVGVFKEFILKRVELINQEVKKYLQNTTIVLEDVNPETGEVKEIFEVRYRNSKGVEEDIRLCSTSEKIKAGLELSDMISKLTGCKYMIVIDNAESIVDYIKPEDQQVIELRVEEGLNLTKVSQGKEIEYKKAKKQAISDFMEKSIV